MKKKYNDVYILESMKHNDKVWKCELPEGETFYGCDNKTGQFYGFDWEEKKMFQVDTEEKHKAMMDLIQRWGR